MGVKFDREYEKIIGDIMKSVHSIDNFFMAFDMTEEEWNETDQKTQLLILQTFSDDLFYALGEDPTFEIGDGCAKYDISTLQIHFYNKNEKIFTINLI